MSIPVERDVSMTKMRLELGYDEYSDGLGVYTMMMTFWRLNRAE